MRHPADLAEDFTLQFFFFSTILNDLDWWAVLRHHGERLRLGLIDGWWCFGIIAMMISFFTLATITPSPQTARDGRTPRTCRLSGVGGGLLQQLDSTGHRGGFGRNGVNRPSRPHCFVRRLASSSSSKLAVGAPFRRRLHSKRCSQGGRPQGLG